MPSVTQETLDTKLAEITVKLDGKLDRAELYRALHTQTMWLTTTMLAVAAFTIAVIKFA
jgi:hypothetical protein